MIFNKSRLKIAICIIISRRTTYESSTRRWPLSVTPCSRLTLLCAVGKPTKLPCTFRCSTASFTCKQEKE